VLRLVCDTAALLCVSASLCLGVEINERETADVSRRLVAPKCNEGENAAKAEAVGIFSQRQTPG